MQSRDKGQTWKTDTRNKEHKATKLVHTKQKKQMSNPDFTENWEHEPGASVG